MNKWNDKWFCYKIISTFLILGGLLILYLYHMISQTWIRTVEYPFSYFLFQGQFFSFFTNQSNIIIGVWFLIATIYHNRKNRLIDNQNITLAVTAYISVTCFVYVAVLVPGFLITKKPIKTEDFITGPYFHLLTPALMIIYSLTHVKKMDFSVKKYYCKNFFLYLIYPWLYTLYIIARIVVYTNIASLEDLPFVIVYPYLPIFESTGDFVHDITRRVFDSVFLIIAFFVLVHLLFIIFNFVYFFTFKKIFKSKKTNENAKNFIF